MRNNSSIKIGLLLLMTILFIVSAVSPMAIEYVVKPTDKELMNEGNYVFACFDKYHITEVSSDDYEPEELPVSGNITEKSFDETMLEGSSATQVSGGPPMDSPWPMYCHDIRHTGRSPYSTVDNPGFEKWRFDTIDGAYGSPVIDKEGAIYIGAHDFYAIYPNGTLKWKYDTPHVIESAAAIDENGIIYVGTVYDYPNDFLYAFYPNGTLKWKYPTGDMFSSPAIGKDGTIYFADGDNWNIIALYPNGTLKWAYKTNLVVYSSPAIGKDGTVYCGSHDCNMYALYPNNGTLKWKFPTDHWIRTSPCISDDGTIYFVSLDSYLYAIYPNGTLKWKTDVGAGTSPTIGQDGTIYAGYHKLHAVNPTNGSIKWTFDPGSDRQIRGGTPCNSADGTIYFGTHIGETDGGELIALNPDGTEKWRKMIAYDWIDSAPAIGEDGTIYVGSCNDGYHPGSWGYLHAIGALDPNAPITPDIDGPTSGNAGTEYEYTFKSTSPIGNDIYYWIEWGDNTGTDWLGPYNSGEEITMSHTWSEEDTYNIRARAKDTDNLWGPWGTLEVTMPRNKIATNSLILKLLETFPNAFPLLRHFLGR